MPRLVEVTFTVRAWLSGDIAKVARITPRRRPGTVSDADGLDVGVGLKRWAGQLTRRRAIVLTRRYLLIALAIALVPAIVVLAAGENRPFWVLGVLLLAPLGGATAVLQRTPAIQAARLLDRQLGLHDQLGTALELQAGPSPAVGLARMVVDEAGVTLARSLATGRVGARRAPAEWTATAFAACALAVVVGVPRHAAGNASRASASAVAGASSGGAGTQRRTTPVKALPSRHRTPLATRGTTSPPAVQEVPLTGGARAAYGVQASTTPGGRPPAYVNGRGTVPDRHTKPGLAVSGGTGAGRSQSAHGQASAGGSRTSTGTSGVTAKAGKAGTVAARPSSGAQGARSGVTSTTPGKTAGAATGSQAGRGSGGTPAGGRAGTGKAAANARLGLTPYDGIGTGTSTLPLEANYTPAAAGHVSATAGVSTTSDGNGNGAGRSAQAGSGPPAAGTSSTRFAVLAPTSDASPSADEGLLDNYFGSANQLTFTGW